MEKHRRYWLRLFGVELRGRTAAQYVQEEGLPPALHDLASTFYAESQRMFIGVGA